MYFSGTRCFSYFYPVMNQAKALLFFLILIISFSCEKDNAYLDQFTGTYSCIKICNYSDSLGNTTSDTSYFNIEVLRYSNSNELLIDNLIIPIDPDGTYNSDLWEIYPYQTIRLKLRDDSLFIDTY